MMLIVALGVPASAAPETIYVIGADSPGQDYRDGSFHSLHSLHEAMVNQQDVLENGTLSQQQAVLLASSRDFHRVSIHGITPWSAEIVSSPDSEVSNPNRLQAQGLLPSSAPRLYSADIPKPADPQSIEDATLDKLLSFTKPSWLDYLWPALLIAGGTLGMGWLTNKFQLNSFLAMILGSVAVGIGGGLLVSAIRRLKAAQTADPTSVLRAAAKNLPNIAVFTAANGVRISIHDAYSGTAKELTPENLTAMRAFLNLLPADHLRNIPAIVSMPTQTLSGAEGFAAPGVGIALHGWENLSGHLDHEIGHHVLFNLPAQKRAEWQALHDKYPDQLAVDAVVTHGDQSWVDEDFALYYENWMKYSQAEKPFDYFAVARPVYLAANGRPGFLEKTLWMTQLFLGDSPNTVRLYSRGDNLAYTTRQAPFYISGDKLFLDNWTFRLEGNTLVEGSSPDWNDGQIIKFPSPVALPSFLRR